MLKFRNTHSKYTSLNSVKKKERIKKLTSENSQFHVQYGFAVYFWDGFKTFSLCLFILHIKYKEWGAVKTHQWLNLWSAITPCYFPWANTAFTKNYITAYKQREQIIFKDLLSIYHLSDTMLSIWNLEKEHYLTSVRRVKQVNYTAERWTLKWTMLTSRKEGAYVN